jgi:hypothetical protein
MAAYDGSEGVADAGVRAFRDRPCLLLDLPRRRQGQEDPSRKIRCTVTHEGKPVAGLMLDAKPESIRLVIRQ